MELPILFEDSEIVVIDKPSGVIVNRAETVRTETVQDWLLRRIIQTIKDLENDTQEDASYFRERGGIVHRLDKETSGVMVVAKTVNAFVCLLREFKEREVKKEYVALTHGIWKEKHGEITATVGRSRHNRTMMGVREDGRDSLTQYRVEQEYKTWHFPKELGIQDKGYSGFSLVRFMPKTGRTHQIRVHARHMGHPIVGDQVYAGRKRSRVDRIWAERLMLHAERLSFVHPITKVRMNFVSPQPFDRINKSFFVLA